MALPDGDAAWPRSYDLHSLLPHHGHVQGARRHFPEEGQEVVPAVQNVLALGRKECRCNMPQKEASGLHPASRRFQSGRESVPAPAG
jgi:hypothetical protein